VEIVIGRLATDAEPSIIPGALHLTTEELRSGRQLPTTRWRREEDELPPV
jgi:hypothetical protein